MRIAVFDELLKAALERTQLLQLSAHVGEILLREIARCRAVAVRRLDEGEEFSDLLDGTQVALTLLLFAAGTALPLLALGLLSRRALTRWVRRLRATGASGKIALGLVLIVTGALILTGYDKVLEAALLRMSPDWLTELTTRI